MIKIVSTGIAHENHKIKQERRLIFIDYLTKEWSNFGKSHIMMKLSPLMKLVAVPKNHKEIA
jgi:uncharacterized FlgJ-related protein